MLVRHVRPIPGQSVTTQVKRTGHPAPRTWRSSAPAMVAQRSWRFLPTILWSDIVAWPRSTDTAPGLALAKRLKIPVTRDYRCSWTWNGLISSSMCLASSEVWESLQDFHRMGVTIHRRRQRQVHVGTHRSTHPGHGGDREDAEQVSIPVPTLRQRNRRRGHGRADAESRAKFTTGWCRAWPA